MRSLNGPFSSTAPQTLYGIVHTGQSLSVGDYGDPPLSTTPAGNVQLFDLSGAYALGSPTAPTLSLVNLAAPVRQALYTGGGGIAVQYPNNIGGESAEIAMANGLFSALGRKYATSCCGQGGAAYSVIGKGGTGNAYAAALYEAQAIKHLNSSYQVSCVLLTHGEADGASATYGANLTTLQSNYQTDLAAITGQSGTIPLLLSQQNTSPAVGSGQNLSGVAQWNAVLTQPGVILGACPKYFLSYYTDRLHLVNTAYRLLGDYYAKALAAFINAGSWTPLIATGFSRTSNTLTVTFNVPVGPLVWDSGHTGPHASGTYSVWANGKGFELWSGGVGGTPVGITSATISGNTVVIVGAATFDTCAYAHTPDNTSAGTYTGGFPDGRCGLLRDSDASVGYASATALPNWAWEFVKTGL